MNQLMMSLATKTIVLGAGLPDFVSLKDWGQEQGQAILVIAMIIIAVWYAFKREWGIMIGALAVIALVYIIVKNPEETLFQWLQGLIDKLMGKGG